MEESFASGSDSDEDNDEEEEEEEREPEIEIRKPADNHRRGKSVHHSSRPNAASSAASVAQ